jgi:nitroreductase
MTRTPLQPSLYDGIFRRRSIRRFVMAPIPDDLVGDVRAFAARAVPLDPSIRVEFVVRHETDVRNLLPNEAPHYLCLYSERKGPYLMNAGYLLQQVDLYLSTIGLGSCWLGIAKPNAKAVPAAPAKAAMHGLDYVIMLAFGRPAVPLHRTSPAEFNRRSLAEIADLPSLSGFTAAAGLPDPTVWLEPVRIAPSATNSQPWRFSGSGESLLVGRERLGLLKEPFMGRMNQVDIGIALCHLDLSLAHHGTSAVFDFTKFPAPDGTESMAFVRTGKDPAC